MPYYKLALKSNYTFHINSIRENIKPEFSSLTCEVYIDTIDNTNISNPNYITLLKQLGYDTPVFTTSLPIRLRNQIRPGDILKPIQNAYLQDDHYILYNKYYINGKLELDHRKPNHVFLENGKLISFNISSYKINQFPENVPVQHNVTDNELHEVVKYVPSFEDKKLTSIQIEVKPEPYHSDAFYLRKTSEDLAAIFINQ